MPKLLTEKVKVSGHVTIRGLDAKTGKERFRIETPNTVCVGAKEAIANLLMGTDADKHQIWSIACGNGTTAPTVADTDLEGPKIYRAPRACESRVPNVGGVKGLIEVQLTILSSEGNILATGEYFTEVALFSRGDNDDPNTATGKLMYARQLHAQIFKDASLALEYTWRFQVTTI